MLFEYKKYSFYTNNQPLLTALLLGLVITASLQLSIIVFSELQPPEKVTPELLVNWLTLPQKRASMQNKKPVPVKPAPVKSAQQIKKKVVKKEVRRKPVQRKKNTYSALAKKVAEIKPSRQENIITNNKSVKANAESNNLPTPVPIFKLTEAPRFLHKEPLEYPESMRTLGNAGIVKLSVLIDKYGVVRKVTIVESAGNEFDDQAKKAILASTFFAAKIKDEPVASILKLSVKFNLI